MTIGFETTAMNNLEAGERFGKSLCSHSHTQYKPDLLSFPCCPCSDHTDCTNRMRRIGCKCNPAMTNQDHSRIPVLALGDAVMVLCGEAGHGDVVMVLVDEVALVDAVMVLCGEVALGGEVKALGGEATVVGQATAWEKAMAWEKATVWEKAMVWNPDQESTSHKSSCRQSTQNCSSPNFSAAHTTGVARWSPHSLCHQGHLRKGSLWTLLCRTTRGNLLSV